MADKAKWKEYFLTKDISLRNELIEDYLPLVNKIAKRVHYKISNKHQIEDLASAGVFGLIDTINKYNPDLDVSFEKFSYKRIKGSMYDYVRKFSWIPRSVIINEKEYNSIESKLELKLGRKPDDEEMAEELNLDDKEFSRFKKKSTPTLVSELKNIDDWEGGYDPTHHLMVDDMKEYLLGSLSKKEKQVFLMYYIEDLTMKEIGKSIGMSEPWVSILLSRELTRLKIDHSKDEIFKFLLPFPTPARHKF